MTNVDLLSFVESIEDDYFTDIHIINDSVVCFYKTKFVKYNNIKGKEEPYLFPTTFKIVENKIQTSMVYGSVDKNFSLPCKINGTSDKTILQIMGVNNHLYKLLVGVNSFEFDNKYSWYLGDSMKSFICIIEHLNYSGFPFMRISNSNSLSEKTP